MRLKGYPSRMKALTGTIVNLAILGLLVATNPSPMDHSTFIRQELAREAQNDGGLSEVLMLLFGGFAESVISNATTRDNYLIFSIYTTNIGEDELVVLGVLGSFLGIDSKKVEEVSSDKVNVTDKVKITDALDCTVSSAKNKYKGTCPYLSDVLDGDEEFKNILFGTFEKYKVQHMDGPEGPLEPIIIDGKKYIQGNKCESHFCGSHRYDFIYSVSDKNVSGIYQPDGAAAYFFGTLNEGEKKKLLEITGR